MNIFLEEHQQLVTDMLSAHIQFILIGGYAVNFHGYNRTTGDLDVWLKPDNNNKIKLINLLKNYDFEDESLNHIEQLDFTQALVFSIGHEPYKTDFLTKVSGVTYEEADKEKIIFEHEGISVPFINLNHLVLTKIGTGRGQDQIDIEKLQQVQRAKGKKR
jgi:hypothetical protein